MAGEIPSVSETAGSAPDLKLARRQRAARPSSARTPRPAANGALHRAERVALAFAVETGNAELPPTIGKLIKAAPQSFADLRLGKIAAIIRSMREHREAVHAEAVAEKSGEGLLLMTEFAGSSLPRDLAELEAETALAAYQVRKAQSVFDDAGAALCSSPGQSKTIIEAAVHSLEQLAGDDSTQDGLTLRSPDEILEMEFDDSDRIIGDRLLATGQSLAVCGAGGIGKSRLLLQMAVACLGGLPFIGFETRGQELKWLVLQAENSNRRLKADLEALRLWVGPDHWPQVNAGLVIHTLETDADGFLSLENERTQARIQDIIASTKPNVVGWDSLYNFGIGDLNNDRDMADTLLTVSRLTKAGDPARMPVVLHHALTGKHGAARAVGFDRSGFGRNSKVLHSWARAQLNLAPGSPDSNERLVVTCGKLSNGREFVPFAIHLDPETMIYAPDETFDVSGWQADVTGKKDVPAMNVDRVAELCTGSLTKATLAAKIRDDCGCCKSASFNWVQRAASQGRIWWTKSTQTYVRKPK